MKAHPENERLQLAHQQLKEKAEYDFVTRLGVGYEFWISGFADPIGMDSQRCAVEVDLIRHLEWNFDKSEATWEDLHLLSIEIHEHHEWMSSTQAQAWDATQSPAVRTGIEFQSPALRINGKEFVVRGNIQQRIIEQLISSSQRGQKLHTSDLLRRAGSQADSLAKVFSKSSAWKHLKGCLEQKNGFCWIADQE